MGQRRRQDRSGNKRLGGKNSELSSINSLHHGGFIKSRAKMGIQGNLKTKGIALTEI